ncbi:MAG: hypothetical protein HYT11_02075 [Candidatus Levybacteria bacterium]|nr:hypothetical protein [Candidatus Levybacteria bacterium]
MVKHFYSHLVETDSLTVMLSDLSLSDTEKKNLLSLIESNMHHTILDLVLSELSEADKKIFLAHVAEEKHDETWKLLNKKVSDIEDKIRQIADNLTKKMHEDISQIRNPKQNSSKYKVKSAKLKLTVKS